MLLPAFREDGGVVLGGQDLLGDLISSDLYFIVPVQPRVCVMFPGTTLFAVFPFTGYGAIFYILPLLLASITFILFTLYSQSFQFL